MSSTVLWIVLAPFVWNQKGSGDVFAAVWQVGPVTWTGAPTHAVEVEGDVNSFTWPSSPRVFPGFLERSCGSPAFSVWSFSHLEAAHSVLSCLE